jgi:hypothetical protein
MTETDLLLMLTGVTRYCSECGGDRIFVEPQGVETPGDDGHDALAEYACTDCGAAMFIDPVLFDLATPTTEVHRRAG